MVWDMWRHSDVLDFRASNEALWKQGVGVGHIDVKQALRARALELRVNPKKERGTSDENEPETCKLCGEKGNWYHVCSVCKHADIRDFYTVRHHATGRVLRRAIEDGSHANFLTLVSFGREGEVAEDVTVPGWMLPKETKRELSAREVEWSSGESVRCGVNPDIVILHGWPATA